MWNSDKMLSKSTRKSANFSQILQILPEITKNSEKKITNFHENFEFLLLQTWFCKTSFFKSSFGFPNLNLQNLHCLAHTYPIKKVLFALHHTVRSELVPFSHQLAFDFLFVKIMIWLTLFLPLCSDAHNGALRKNLVRS